MWCFYAHVLLRCPCMHTLYIWTMKPTVPLLTLQCPSPLLNWLSTPQYHVKRKKESSVVSNSLRPHGLYSTFNSPVQNTGVGSLSLLQGIFPKQGLNPGLLHCRRILYQLSHKGSFQYHILTVSPPPTPTSWLRLHLICTVIQQVFIELVSCTRSWAGEPVRGGGREGDEKTLPGV